MGEMSILNKICVFCCCSQAACFAAQVTDGWGSIQAQLQCELNCCAGCWALCYPIWSKFEMGDSGVCTDKCILGAKYCLLSCGLCFVSEFDGCINCFFYTKKIFTEGVSGWKDVTEHADFLGKKVREALADVDQKSEEPSKTFGTYSP